MIDRVDEPEEATRRTQRSSEQRASDTVTGVRQTHRPHASRTQTMRVCIVGASGKLGRYMVQHALDRDYDVVGVCREESVGKLDAFEGRITVVPGATDDREVIKRAVAGCDGVLVLIPRGVHGYSSGTA
jgi:5,10-methylene-tetrahydrofolate dehydrogenase/methenyl tetrahydrofolate cyclohydrolase